MSEQTTITQAQYESAVKGRQDSRNAYRNLLPVLRAAEELSRLWRTKGQRVDDKVFFNAINAIDVAVTGGGAKPDPEHLARSTSLAAQDGLEKALHTIVAMMGNVNHDKPGGPNDAALRGGMLMDCKAIAEKALSEIMADKP